jgi:hypothetical protein
VDLVEKQRYGFWPARIQGQRQTCIAFAAAACIELLRAGDERQFEPLSPQFLYWHMRRMGPGLTSDGKPPPGWDKGATKLGQAKEILIEYGICTWSASPYMDRLPPDDPPVEGPRPTDAVIKAAAANRIAAAVSRIADADNSTFYFDCPDPGKREPGVARMVYDLLAKKRPVAIAIPVFYSTTERSETNWDNPVTTNSGEVIDPVEGDWTPGHSADTRAPRRDTRCASSAFNPIRGKLMADGLSSATVVEKIGLLTSTRIVRSLRSFRRGDTAQSRRRMSNNIAGKS